MSMRGVGECAMWAFHPFYFLLGRPGKEERNPTLRHGLGVSGTPNEAYKTYTTDKTPGEPWTRLAWRGHGLQANPATSDR